MMTIKFRDIPQFTVFMDKYQRDLFWVNLESELQEFKEGWNLDMNPDFQRGHVWDEEKQKNYIEFVLKGGHSSKDIYFNAPNWNTMRSDTPMVLVDGKQRIEAVLKFIRNELAIFDGNYFKDFEDKLSLNARFRIYINELPDRASELQWYLDLNTGGVIHTNEEIEKVKKMLEKETCNKRKIPV